MKIDNVEIMSTIVCDDVRREANGKEILIGVYGSDILLPQFPALISPIFWIQFLCSTPGSLPVNFRVMNENDIVFVEGKGEVDVKRPEEPISLAIGSGPVQAQGAMKLLFQLKIGESEWVTVRSIEVRKRLQTAS